MDSIIKNGWICKRVVGIGVLLVLFVAQLACVSLALARQVTYTVTNTSGRASVSGSLPWAVDQARDAGRRGDEPAINFNIAGSAPHTIQLENFLWIEQKTKIDARTQPGYAGEPLIWIDANGNDSAFILEKGVGSTIAGFRIYNFAWNAIATQPAANETVISGNHIGFYWDSAASRWWRNFEADLSSWQARGKFVTAVGIGIQSSYNKIENNVIAGVHNGVSIGYDPEKELGPVCRGNEIRNNFLGTTPDGSAILTNTPGALSYRPDSTADPFGIPEHWAYFGNNSDGIYLTALAVGTIIADNVSSGNYSVGIELLHNTVEQSIIYGNKCGVDASGSKALPNGELGIIISYGAHDNIVGGDYGPNICSGNPFAGIQLGGAGSFSSAINNLIKGNIVGCNSGKTASIGNQDVGIHIGTPESYGNQIEANTIGGNGWGLYLDNTRDNVIIGNFIGTSENENDLGNDNDGLVLDNSTGNVVLNNLAMYNGFNTSHTDWGLGIWNFNGSSGNVYSGNDIRGNRNSTNITQQALPGCVYLDRYLGLTMVCATYAGISFRFHLDYYANPRDPNGIYWKLDLNSLRNSAFGDCCVTMDNDLGFTISGAQYSGLTLAFDLDFSPNSEEPATLLWKLDPTSLRVL